MKKTLLSLGTAALLGLASVSASAAVINVGGVSWNPDSGLDFTSVDTMYESVVTATGQVVTGYGKILQLNGTSEAAFCVNCELTYKFSYTLSNIGANGYTFSGGSFKVYVDSAKNWNPDTNGAGLAAAATDGTLWLDLAGHNSYSVSSGLVGTLHSDPTPVSEDVAGDGQGYLDVVTGTGALASGNFDTNKKKVLIGMVDGLPQYDYADFFYTSSFNLIPDGGAFVTDGVPMLMFGSNDLKGNSIPEPGSMALLGLGLAGLGFAQRRRNAAK